MSQSCANLFFSDGGRLQRCYNSTRSTACLDILDVLLELSSIFTSRFCLLLYFPNESAKRDQTKPNIETLPYQANIETLPYQGQLHNVKNFYVFPEPWHSFFDAIMNVFSKTIFQSQWHDNITYIRYISRTSKIGWRTEPALDFYINSGVALYANLRYFWFHWIHIHPYSFRNSLRMLLWFVFERLLSFPLLEPDMISNFSSLVKIFRASPPMILLLVQYFHQTKSSS